ncbi:MAG: M23 family metallopeptidase [Bacteroidales bacterium]|nr:M23 family metallopeptidase [Bacteroidales bacterium]
MADIKKWRHFWKRIRINWKVKYDLIILNENTHEESINFRLSPRNIFVAVTVSAVVLIALTAVIIAFTPLRYYIPGYTTPNERKKYEAMATEMKDLQSKYSKNEQYMANMSKLLNEDFKDTLGPAPENTEAISDGNALADAAEVSESEMSLREEAGDLLKTVSARQSNDAVAVSARADIQNLFLQPPTTGTIITAYSVPQNQYGIDVANQLGTLVTSAADGMVIYSGYDVYDGNVIIVQHHDNVLTIYKNNSQLLKNKGAKVSAGEPIARMGHSGITDKGNHLHFELWHNGFPLNPLDYITLK